MRSSTGTSPLLARRGDRGFSLVELLVVVVIIGILAGIAIPMFLAQRRKGVDAGLRADIKAVSTAMETHHTDDRDYTTDQSLVEAAGDAVELTDGNVIDVVVAADGDAYCVTGWHEDANHDADAPLYYASDAGGFNDTAAGACTATTTPQTWVTAGP